MKLEVMKKEEIEVTFVDLAAAVRYGDEDMPLDFPGRNHELWRVLIAINNGDLYLTDGKAFPEDVTLDLHMKVCDQCAVRLLDLAQEPLAAVEDEYVPGFFPGQHYGDYIIFNIAGGKVTNWKASKSDVQSWLENTVNARD